MTQPEILYTVIAMMMASHGLVYTLGWLDARDYYRERREQKRDRKGRFIR